MTPNKHQLKYDVTLFFQQYRTEYRDLWNRYFLENADVNDWDSADAFETFSKSLFELLVVFRSKLFNAEHLEGKRICFELIPNLPMHKSEETVCTIHVSENECGKRGSTWNYGPSQVTSSDIKLKFRYIWDWSSLDYRDAEYYLCLITESTVDPTCINRLAIVKASEVRVVACPSDLTDSDSETTCG